MVCSVQRSTFLPLTMSSLRSAPPLISEAATVHRCAEATEATAIECWAALLGGCEIAPRRVLPGRLSALTDATATFVGRTWCQHRPEYRRRVGEARQRIDAAVRDGDGAEFAEAFAGYDEMIATAVVSGQTTRRIPTP